MKNSWNCLQMEKYEKEEVKFFKYSEKKLRIFIFKCVVVLLRRMHTIFIYLWQEKTFERYIYFTMIGAVWALSTIRGLTAREYSQMIGWNNKNLAHTQCAKVNKYPESWKIVKFSPGAIMPWHQFCIKSSFFSITIVNIFHTTYNAYGLMKWISEAKRQKKKWKKPVHSISSSTSRILMGNAIEVCVRCHLGDLIWF